MYTGCTQAGFSQGVGVPYNYPATFGAGKVDVWESNLNPIENSTCSSIPNTPWVRPV
jgi:hypothetical protein